MITEKNRNIQRTPLELMWKKTYILINVVFGGAEGLFVKKEILPTINSRKSYQILCGRPYKDTFIFGNVKVTLCILFLGLITRQYIFQKHRGLMQPWRIFSSMFS